MADPVYRLSNVRALLLKGFDDRELRRLCYDVPDFRPVYDRLAEGTGKAEIVDELLRYAESRLLIDTLLALAKERNPIRYEYHVPYYTENAPSHLIQKQLANLATGWKTAPPTESTDGPEGIESEAPRPFSPHFSLSLGSVTTRVLLLIAVLVSVTTLALTGPSILGLFQLGVAKPTVSMNETPLPLMFAGSGSFRIPQGQMLLVRTANSVALIRFLFHREGAAYEWRYLATESDQELGGTDDLYQEYARTPTAEGNHLLVDVGSKLMIKAGSIELQWSSGGPAAGWVYVDDLTVATFDDQTFSSFDLRPYLYAPTYSPP